MSFLLLCWEFFKIGLFAVGGGLATLPFLSDLAARHPEWVTPELLGNIVAIGESTPGPIGVNMATYVGYSAFGIPGAICTTLSLVLPSLVVIIVIAKMLKAYQDNRFVKTTFSLLRPAVTGLIAAAGWSMFRLSMLTRGSSPDGIGEFFRSISIPAIILFVLLAGTMQIPKLKKLHPIVWIAIGAAAGIVFQM